MELLQLRYFLLLAEKQNLTKTAEELFISPSSLSFTISKLEKELGAQFFDRTGRKMRLNKKGEMFYEHIRNGLAEIDLAISMIQCDTTVSVITDSPSMWSSMFSDFLTAQPDILINNRVIRRRDISPDMLLHEYDFWLASSDTAHDFDQLNKIELSSCELCIAVPDSSPLAGLSSVPLGALKDENFLFPSIGYQYYDLYRNACLNAGFEPKIVANCGLFVRLKLVSAGQGITFVDGGTRNSDFLKNISFVSISDAPKVHPTFIYWHKDRILSKPAKSFLQFITFFFEDP